MYLFGDEICVNGNLSVYGMGKIYFMECMVNELVVNRILVIFVIEEMLFGDIKLIYSKDGVEMES